MKKKMLISTLLVLSMILSLFSPIGSFAKEAKPTITVGSVQAKPGDTVDIKVSIANNPGFLGAALLVSYDEGLELVDSKSEVAFGALTMTKPGSLASPCKYVWDAVELSPEDIIDGDIMTLTFKVSDKVKGNEKLNVHVSYDNGDFIDSELNPVDIQVVDGIVSIKSYTPGDVSGEGQVTTADVVLIRRYIAGGYDVSFNLDAADVNGDAKINTLDLILIRRFLAGGYTDENGDPLVLKEGRVSEGQCVHNMTPTEYKAATCEQDGNIAYWYCNNCNKYFRDENGVNEVSESGIVIKALGHTPVVDPAVPATTTSTGLTEGLHCSVCNKVLVEQEVVPKLNDNRDKYHITYYIDQDDSYIRSLNIENKNPEYYYVEDGLKLQNLKADGLVFDGWYDAEGASGQLVRTIPAGATGDIELYAKWTLRKYTITFDSPLDPIPSVEYTVNKGATLTNPKWFGYNFMGWSNEDGEIVTSIPKGTTGNITLYANWMSKRNQTRKVKKLGSPIVYEDEDKGQYLFAYEIGQIENVPLYTMEDFGNGNGISITSSITTTSSISESTADSIVNTLANSTTNTSTWQLSKNWNKSATEIQSHTDENGVTTTTTNSLSSSDNNVRITSNTKGVTDTNTVSSTDNLSAGVSMKAGAEGGAPGIGKVSVEVEGHMDYGYSDTDTVSKAATWNSSDSTQNSSTTSSSSSTSSAISSKVSNTYGYNKTISEGGSEAYASSNSNTVSESNQYSTSLTYSTKTEEVKSKTYTNAGNVPGYYRLVAATTIHVFGVVGYDIGTSSYFVYTMGIQDDNTYDYVDYSYSTHNFDDLETGVLPFEVPYSVHEYVSEAIAESSGLVIDKKTGYIAGFSGKATDVIVPDYIAMSSVNDKPEVIKIKGIDGDVFKGKTKIKSVTLGKYVTDISPSAFEGCTSLTTFSAPGVTEIGSGAFKNCSSLTSVNVSPVLTKIGDNAFNGCTKLNDFAIGKKVESVGSAAFNNVGGITVSPSDVKIIQDACDSGAKNITIDISGMSDIVKNMTIIVPESTETFELDGDKSTYNNLIISSKAATTILNKVSINNVKTVPLTTSSGSVKLSSLDLTSSGFGLILNSTNTTLTLDGTVTISSSGVGSVLTRNLSLAQLFDNSKAKLVTNGDVFVCKSINQNDLLQLGNGNQIHIIDEDSFIALKAGNLDWVLASEVPSGARILDTKWTFDLTTNDSSYNGQSLADKEYELTDYSSWSSWSRTKYTSSTTRQVETKNVNDNVAYNINTYYYYKDPGALQFSYYAEGGNWQYYEFTQKNTDSPQMYAYGSYGGKTTYRLNNNNGGHGVNFDAEVWWMKSSVPVYNTHTEYRYRDRSKIYRNMESTTEVTSSSSISNVQKWVKYVVE